MFKFSRSKNGHIIRHDILKHRLFKSRPKRDFFKFYRLVAARIEKYGTYPSYAGY